MSEMTAAAQLQAWLDGQVSVLSKSAVRTVLWDLAEAQTQLERIGNVEAEWTVARHWRHSIEYGAFAMSESLVRDEVHEELECGAQASVAYRLAGQWRHEDPEAQKHADAIDAAVKAAGR